MRIGVIVALGIVAFAEPFGNVALADGDPAAGRRVWTRCAACHLLNASGNNTVGPNLYKIVGRKAGTVAKYEYKSKLKDATIVWTEDELEKFLKDPKPLVAGSAMQTFAGIPSEKEREDLIAYIKDVSK
jgi:cytochrome c